MDCGKGVQTREVFCGTMDGPQVEIVDKDNCKWAEEPPNTQECVVEGPCKGAWFTGPWSKVCPHLFCIIDPLSAMQLIRKLKMQTYRSPSVKG